MKCEKYKKKAIIGAILLSYFGLIRIIDLTQYIDVSILILSAILLGSGSLILVMPYIRCLQKLNKPFDKL